jgi:hypothetical protein
MDVGQLLSLKYSINQSRIEQSIELAGLFLLHDTSVKNYWKDEGIWKELSASRGREKQYVNRFPLGVRKVKQPWRR